MFIKFKTLFSTVFQVLGSKYAKQFQLNVISLLLFPKSPFMSYASN